MRVTIAWLVTVLLITFLYVGVPALWLNRVYPTIFGVPELYIWYVFVPLITPAILGGLYLFDKKCRACTKED